MRSWGAPNFGLALSVVVLTKSRMACLAGPSFHEGSGSTAAVGWAAVGAVGVGLLLQPTRVRVKKSDKSNARRIFISSSPSLAVPSRFHCNRAHRNPHHVPEGFLRNLRAAGRRAWP